MTDTILKEVIADLSANYSVEDESVLKSIIDDTIADALSISNRKNNDITMLKSEIKRNAKIRYLNRGVENNKSLSANGESSTYIEPYEELEKDIIRNGHRKVF